MRTFRSAFFLLLLVASVATAPAAEVVNGIYVVVNDAVITYDEVEASIAPMIDILVSQYHSNPQVLEQKVQQTRADRIEELVQRQLILNDFKTAGYQLPDSFVDDSVSRIIHERYGDRAKLTKTLQAEGITFEEFRRRERDRIIIDELTHVRVSPEKIVVSPNKVEAYYQAHKEQFKTGDELHLRMIVLNKTADNAEGMKKLAEEIQSKLDEGTPFADMASIYSQGSYKDKGGDRGWVDRTTLKKELSDVAFTLNAGQHSKVIDLPEACYLLFVEDKRMARTKPVSEVRSEIESTLRSQEGRKIKDRWISRLKSKAYIRYY